VNAGVNDIWATAQQTMPTNTRIPVGSVTKPYTAVALMKLVEQGKISLDEKAHVRLDYILQNFRPNWANKGTFQEVWGNNPQVNNITVRELAEMKSGLDDYDGTAVYNAYLNSPLVTLYISDYIDMTKKTLKGAPGTFGPWYTSTGFGLLGLIVANASGLAPQDYLSLDQLDIIFGPKAERQGLAQSAFRDSDFIRGGLCSEQPFPVAHSFYSISEGTYPSTKIGALEQDLYNYACTGGYGFGSLASTVREIASFFYMLLSGEELILKNSTLNQMMNFEPMQNPWAVDYNYGMGLFWNRNEVTAGTTPASSTAPLPSTQPSGWVQYPATPQGEVWTVNHGGATWASGAGPAGYDPESGISFVVIYTTSATMSTDVSLAEAAVQSGNQICTQLSVARVALGYSALQCSSPSTALSQQASVGSAYAIRWAETPETTGLYGPCRPCMPTTPATISCASCFFEGFFLWSVAQCFAECSQCTECYSTPSVVGGSATYTSYSSASAVPSGCSLVVGTKVPNSCCSGDISAGDFTTATCLPYAVGSVDVRNFFGCEGGNLIYAESCIPYGVTLGHGYPFSPALASGYTWNGTTNSCLCGTSSDYGSSSIYNQGAGCYTAVPNGDEKFFVKFSGTCA